MAEQMERRVLFSTTFLVTNTADSGAGSLRQAITSADSTNGSSVIDFSIGTGAQTISPLSALPTLSSNITLDATTQPGYAGTPLIEISGASAGNGANGLVVTGGNCTIRGLAVDSFNSNGIWLSGTGGDTVQGDYVGLSLSGLAAAGNASNGILVTSPNDLIGGPLASNRNIVSGNAVQGIDLYSSTATGDLVEGNYCGTNAAGTGSVPNAACGICIYAANDDTIGGLATGDGNVLSGNTNDGLITVGGASGILVQGNLMGTDPTGLLAVPNGFYGIEVDSAYNVVGGLVPTARNIISGNDQAGVVLFLPPSNNNIVEGNYIGTDITGAHALGAQPDGVDIDDGAYDNTIGGTTLAACNVISGNVLHGLYFGEATNGNVAEGNYIGTTPSGTSGVGNGLTGLGGLGPGVLFDYASTGNIVGGTTPGSANVISGNGTGVILFGATGSAIGNTVEGNLIGATAAGAAGLSNVGDGVLILGNNNTIGGNISAAGNVILGSTAIVIGSGTGNLIAGNTYTPVTITAPVVTLTSPASGVSTNNNEPTFSGSASNATGYSSSVTIYIYSGSAATGTAVQTLTASVSAGTYSVAETSALPDGTYTAVASQADTGAPTATSTADTFTIDTTPPIITLSTPLNGGTASNNKPTFSGASGTAAGDSPNITVNIYSGTIASGTPVQTVTATASAGLYSVGAYRVLADGTYTAVATEFDAAGNTGSSTPDTFTIDTTPPTVTLATPGNGVSTNNNQPNFSGNAGNASGDLSTITVAIYSGTLASGTPVQTLTTSASAGGYSVSPLSSLPDGTYTAQASQSDSFGNTGTSTAQTFTIDTMAPILTLTAPGNGTSTNTNKPTFSGAAGKLAGDLSTIIVTIYGGSLASGTPVQTLTTTASAGAYSVAPTLTLSDGTYTAVASQTDTAGNTGTSTADTFTIDTTPPVVTLLTPTSAGSSNNNAPTFSGAAGTASGDSATITLTIYSGAVAAGTPVQTLTTSASAGSYSVAASPALLDGTYTAVASQSDAAGNIGKCAADTFTIDTVAPVLTLAAPLPSGETTNTSPTFSGAAGSAAGDLATITINIYSGSVIGGTPVQTLTTTAASGSYSVGASSPLNNGTYTAQASQSDAAGNTGTSAPDTFTIDPTAPTVFVFAPSSGSLTNNNTPTFSGTAGFAPADSATVSVNLYTGSAATATPVQILAASVDPSTGDWSVAASPSLFDGTYTVVATQSDGTGTSDSAPDTFTVDTTPPSVTLTAPTTGASIKNNSPTFSGAAGTAAGDLSTITLNIYSGNIPSGTPVQTLTGTASAGAYSIAALSSLPDGTYTAQASQSDKAGNTGVSAADTFTVDTAAPIVTLTAPTASSSIKNNQPTFSGSAGTASGDQTTITVKIFSGSVASGTPVQTLTTTASAGAYSVATNSTLPDGTYTAVVSQSDLAGNVGTTVGETFTVDTTPPILTLTAPVSASSSTNTTPTFGGAAGTASGDLATITVKIYSGSTAAGTPVRTLTTTAAAGIYSAAASSALPVGTYTAQASQSDAAGNVGLSAADTFTVQSAVTIGQLTGTPSANTTSSWNNTGATYTSAFDGNTNTSFDAPTANGNWIQLDLGSAHTITSIAFAPRVGFESRMIGGLFEVSNDPTFSTGVVTLFMISTAPVDGLTSVAVSPAASYRYVRYVSPAGSYGNIAEMQVFGPTSGTVSPPAAPGTPTLVTSTSTTATIAWTASTSVGITGYLVFRNGAQIGTTSAATLTYPDNGLSASATYSYTAEAVAGGLDSLPSNALSITTPGATTTTGQLTGSPSANTTSSWNNTGTVYTNVFDGNTNTFFDAPTANGNWVQLDLGSAHTITSIAYAPRVGFESRMIGGIFEVSNDPTFSTGVVTLFTVATSPADGLNNVPVSLSSAYRYVRYVSPAGSYGNIAEMQVFGPGGTTVSAPNPPGTPTLTSSTSTTATIAWTASTSAGISGYLVFRNGTQIGSTSATTLTYPDTGLTAATTYSYTVEAVAGGVDSLPTGALSVTTPPSTAPPTQLKGTPSANTTSSYNNTGTVYTNVFDGNTNTFFDAPTANGNWVQLDLGAAHLITSIAYAPRVGFESRMIGGIFEASNDPTFATGAVTLFTVTTAPPDGLATVSLSAAGTYRYIRYVSPAGSYGNIAEMQIFGR